MLEIILTVAGVWLIDFGYGAARAAAQNDDFLTVTKVVVLATAALAITGGIALIRAGA